LQDDLLLEVKYYTKYLPTCSLVVSSLLYFFIMDRLLFFRRLLSIRKRRIMDNNSGSVPEDNDVDLPESAPDAPTTGDDDNEACRFDAVEISESVVVVDEEPCGSSSSSQRIIPEEDDDSNANADDNDTCRRFGFGIDEFDFDIADMIEPLQDVSSTKVRNKKQPSNSSNNGEGFNWPSDRLHPLLIPDVRIVYGY
jgi:hypothetical protein